MKSKTKSRDTDLTSIVDSKINRAIDPVFTDSLQALPVGVIIATLSNIVFVNQTSLKLLNVSKTQQKKLNKKSVFDFILPQYHLKMKRELKTRLENGTDFTIETQIKNAINQIFDVEIVINRVVFNTETLIQFVFTKVIPYKEKSISTKINLKTEQQETLRKETEENFKLITENANDIIYFVTYKPKQKYIYVSPSVKKTLGYSPSDFNQNPNLASEIVIDKRAYITFKNKLAKQQKNKTFKPITEVFQYQTKSGKLIWMEDSYSAIYDESKNIKFILGISRNITNEKNYQLELEQKWNNYQNLIETSPIGIIIHDEGVCLYCNKTALDILEEKEKSKVIGKRLTNLFLVPEQLSIAMSRIVKATNGEESSVFTFKIKTKKNNTIDIEIKTVPFIYNGKKCVQSIISNVSAEKKLANETLRAKVAEESNKKLIHEIEYRKKIQHELVTQTNKYEAIFNNTSHLIWSINKDLQITSFNKNYANYIKKIFGYTISVGDYIGKVKTKNEQNENLSLWLNKYKHVFNNKKDNSAEFFEIQSKDVKGKTYYREVFLHPIRNNKGLIEEIAIIAHDITENKRFEKQIIEQSAKLKAIFESGNQLMWTVGNNKTITSFNQNYANAHFDLYGYYPEIGKNVDINKTPEYHTFWNDKYETALSGKQVEFISERVNRNGSKIIRQMLLYPIKDNENNVIEISGIGFDITENKKNEERITQSLKEKEVLLKEVHHRVKNNMQVISSILNLQSSYVKDPYALNLLKECQNRIKSMAFIHESLYQTKNFESVNFSEYVTILSKNLIHTYSVNPKKVKLILTLDKLFLNLDASISCGLIINEIISNSLKYAFSDNRDGIIFVTLKAKNNYVKIEAGDNGIGIPENINIKQTDTLGLQLVDTLVEQINGSLILDRTKGTKFIIEFKN